MAPIRDLCLTEERVVDAGTLLGRYSWAMPREVVCLYELHDDRNDAPGSSLTTTSHRRRLRKIVEAHFSGDRQ
jgi:hypothetical protein